MTINCIHLLFRKMSSSIISVLTPNNVRGMKVLDREKFLRHIEVPVLKVTKENLAKITQLCKPYFLKLENFKPIADVESNEDSPFSKNIHLNPDKINEWTSFLEEDRKKMIEIGVDEKNFFKMKLELTYNNWTYDTIFKAVLPENEEIVSGFSQIGHIIHLNLRDHLLDYRPLIGQVLVDKVKTCRTVVNKSNIIDNTYRNFSMEVIAGDEDFFVTVKENNIIFQFDFSKVYWNPRLGKEHERILNYLNESDVLFDVFCGVGPFSLPAAKRKCTVFANDLNPESFKWLKHNAKNNKIKPEFFNAYNLDGKDFICSVFKDYIQELCEGKISIDEKAVIHITMNLPAMAVEFLKYFKGLIKGNIANNLKNEIIVYVYCFVPGDDSVASAKQLVSESIGYNMADKIQDVSFVRKVGPNKEMMRVTFNLSDEILSNKSELELSEPPSKKLCVEN
ncbi:tRNA (guanine(37)-N1)-methyltransferase [Manduca sexta]|uniref:tRNA (guanine(37)-N1)-methyltransferase n=1 Tax=Manduca sexta TaxID=7130 RepID=UPI00188FDE26|nr:tRNA (guanine(37)-N1)-methyltransferase [Manduca sexta]